MNTINVQLDNNETLTELNAVIIERHLMLEKEQIPAVVTSDGKIHIMVHKNFGYVDHNTFKELKTANIGTMPIGILALEKYYFAAEQGKLSGLWEE